MEYSLLAVDLDGTLFNNDREIDQETIDAIHTYRNRGGKVVICSGRSPLSTKWISETIGLHEPIIAYNGAVLIDEDGQTIEQARFSQQAILTFLDICQSNGIYTHLYEGDILLVPERNKWNLRWIEKNIPALERSGGKAEICAKYRNQCSVKHVEDLRGYIEETNPDITKMAVFQEEGSLHSFSALLKKQATDLEISSSFDFVNLEISPAGITKGAALIKLVEHLGLHMSQVAAIGDNYNDLVMIETAGLGIAMGNAPEKVKHAADAVTETNSNGGVAKAIENYLLK
ncbi:Cof-type HAD-IIB family hydrolase [Bacillus sp. T33-2]|uniref:Cof-type HAD-IIB family hydrolase n=1 Tax=Bacillus sp. T33-2 TaxID=2054168 RepID=UPI0015E0C214|nr:Cof-type HAD-IIB family hydrolase [Bacillus sp. T33-2]